MLPGPGQGPGQGKALPGCLSEASGLGSCHLPRGPITDPRPSIHPHRGPGHTHTHAHTCIQTHMLHTLMGGRDQSLGKGFLNLDVRSLHLLGGQNQEKYDHKASQRHLEAGCDFSCLASGPSLQACSPSSTHTYPPNALSLTPACSRSPAKYQTTALQDIQKGPELGSPMAGL